MCRRLTRSHELQRRRGSVLQLPDLDVEPCEATLAQSSPKGGLYAIRTDSVSALVLAQHLGAGRQRHPSALDGFLSAQTVCKRRGPGRMKHIELRTRAIQDWVVSGRLNLAGFIADGTTALEPRVKICQKKLSSLPATPQHVIASGHNMVGRHALAPLRSIF